MSITADAVKSLSDDELARFVEAGIEEQQARAERKKQETIAKIKQLAGSVGVRIAIGGVRGRPVKAKAEKPASSAAGAIKGPPQPANDNAAATVRKPA
jgi:hypothetical protein